MLSVISLCSLVSLLAFFLGAKAKGLHDSVLEEGRDFAPAWDSGDPQVRRQWTGKRKGRTWLVLG